MSRYVSVEGFSNLVRDKKTNAILNIDKRAIEEAKERKKIKQEKRMQENELKDKVNKLETDISEIKEAIQLLLKRSI